MTSEHMFAARRCSKQVEYDPTGSSESMRIVPPHMQCGIMRVFVSAQPNLLWSIENTASLERPNLERVDKTRSDLEARFVPIRGPV